MTARSSFHAGFPTLFIHSRILLQGDIVCDFRNHNNINRFADFNRAVNISVFIHIHSFIYSLNYSYMLISARHVITFKKNLFVHFARFKCRQHFPDRLI